MDLSLLKQSLNIDENAKITVSKIRDGYKISINQEKGVPPQTRTAAFKYWCGENKKTFCYKCKQTIPKNKLHLHHIIYKSAGGKDIAINLLPLCFNCHTGNNGIHLGKWKVEGLLKGEHLELLRKEHATSSKES